MGAEQINAIKAERFTKTAQTLTGKNITAKVIDDQMQPPADYRHRKLTGGGEIRINQANIKGKSPVESLMVDRAKLFHEIDHAVFTSRSADKVKKELEEKTKAPKFFEVVAQTLEDGRIERKGRERWAGTGPYLDAILEKVIREGNLGDGPLGGLALYVRQGIWRNEKEAKYWEPYLSQLDKAVAADSTDEMLGIAFELAEALGKKEPKQGKGKGEPVEGEGESGEPINLREPMSEEAETKVKDITTKAQALLHPTVAADLESIRAEAREPIRPEEQRYVGNEESQAEEIAALFKTLLAEVNQQKRLAAREGRLNSLGLYRAKTTGKVFLEEEDRPIPPKVALLLDVSGSMGSAIEDALSFARILNGALRKADIESRFWVFGTSGMRGDEIEEYPSVPLVAGRGWFNGTPLASALAAANDWFEGLEGAQRPLVLAVTDGGPNDPSAVMGQRARLERQGGVLAGVMMIGNRGEDLALKEYMKREKFTLRDLFTTYEQAGRNKDSLIRVIEPIVTEYIQGGGSN